MRILLTGGVKSGKSRFAVQLAEDMWEERFFLATGVAFDDEMRERIRLHREQRSGRFSTLEEPVEIDRVIRENLILDDITVWMSNLFYHKREEEWEEILQRAIEKMGRNIIVVTNETGMGNIPMDPEVRRYNRYLGGANGRLAAVMDRVYLLVSGIPVLIKGGE